MSSSTEDLEKIVEIIAESPDGAAIGDLDERLEIHRRTIHRRLTALIEDGRIRREGKARATRYFASDVPSEEPPASTEEPPSEPAFSAEARKARQNIQKPLTARSPVSYRAPFLEDYEPGESRYLSEQTRQTLRDIGNVSEQTLPAGTYARRILDRLLIDLSWNSSRLEGNTYSLLETERLLEAGIEAEDRDPVETQMIVNHKAAIEFLVESADSNRLTLHRHTVLNLHALLSENLLGNPDAEGRLRNRPVRISGTVYEPLDDPHRLQEYFDKILAKARTIGDPFEQAFFALVHLPYLQPFIDANKRTSRLAANIPFIRENLAPLSFIEVSPQDYTNAMLAIYEQNDVAILRDLFVWAYRRSADRYRAIQDSMGEPDPYRLKRREELRTLVHRIIRNGLSRSEAEELIETEANSLPAD